MTREYYFGQKRWKPQNSRDRETGPIQVNKDLDKLSMSEPVGR